jgi:hypothetical protein
MFEIKKKCDSFKYQFVFVQTGKASGTFYTSVTQPPGRGPYRPLASIIPGRERFSWNLSF